MTGRSAVFHARIEKVSAFLVIDGQDPNVGDLRPTFSADEAVTDVPQRRDRPEPQHQHGRVDIDIAPALIGHMDPATRIMQFAKGVIAHANGFRTNERPRQQANAMADGNGLEN